MTSSSVPTGSGGPDATDPDGDSQGAVGPGVPAEDLRVTRRRRRWYWAAGLVLAVGAVLGAAFVPTPYVLIQPGAVRAAEERISVEGTESYPNDSSVLFTTVFVDDATLFGLLRGAVDDAIEVRSDEEVYGDRGRDETRRINRREMDLSKLIAEREALTYLGYDAEFTADGVRVVEVADDVPAAGVLRPGDVIVSVDGVAVHVPEELRSQLAGHRPGDRVTLGIERGSMPAGESASSEETTTESLSVDVQLIGADEGPGATDGADGDGEGHGGDGSREGRGGDGHGGDGSREGHGDDGSRDEASTGSEPRAVLGVTVEPFDPRIESEVRVSVDSGDVTGPSAGLAWSLAIIDVLTPGSLTGDRDVAVTGEILPDGSVGVIGGTVQKTATVVRNGVDVFMFPAGTPADEQAEMRRIAGDHTELVPVATLDEAVEYLEPGGLRPG